mmetsp:Transcript_2170/g.5015  ORF Transcript_2170/g.5015 Transcript_2170/m.5015 type:complete len:564 (-) Transcript_2170:113-1804(-)|eukprot:CAMPEP_0170621092 /NCGR_PEP_ID=MMETSP0224-20130122/28418_1 /TAXON_ID=285029 /ORGANISM="Togula jolla, Strain CCCM 725" /LENGTH=563 /DNA_ID=CAMNT_0010947331 /DNA_START=47 /DNA_END=1738 /DNA_ORIENTATION=+
MFRLARWPWFFGTWAALVCRASVAEERNFPGVAQWVALKAAASGSALASGSRESLDDSVALEAASARPVLQVVEKAGASIGTNASGSPETSLRGTLVLEADKEIAATASGGMGAVRTGLAAVGGALSATGANVLAWSSHKARMAGGVHDGSKAIVFFAACFVLNLAGIALFALSCALGGAVATVMPIQTGANLLANMFWQICLRIKHFSKSMRIGTLILVLAVGELSQIGPQEPDHLDVGELLKVPAAIAWCVTLVICTIFALVASLAALRRPVSPTNKLCSFTLLVSLTTVIGSSLGKCFGLLSGAPLVLIVGLYFLDGVVLMGFTLLANAQCDVSIYIPAQLSSQLVINMITGFLVWGDAKYIDRPVPYISVYIISVLAVYLMSPEVDLLTEQTRLFQIRRSLLSETRASTSFGEAVLRLLEVWRGQVGQKFGRDKEQGEACLKALQDTLQEGLEKGAISSNELVDLTMLLLKDSGPGPNAIVVHWLEEKLCHFKLYVAHDPEFSQLFRQTLCPEELGRLDTIAEAEQSLRARLRPVGALPGMDCASTAGVALEPILSNDA